MRFSLTAILAGLTVAVSVPAFAELQNVEVGGSLRIRGNYYSSEATGFPGRAYGEGLGARPGGTLFTEPGHSSSFREMWTRLNVNADFTNDVSVFIELDSYDIWGEDFRGGTGLTGIDGRQGAFDDVEVYQSYIETRESFGYPITTRIGRQEIELGSEWLVGNNDTASFFRGLSFDGITMRYSADTWNVMGFMTKLADNLGAVEEDGDIDFYGIYGSYTGIEDWTIDAYWLYLRDGRGTRLGFPNATGLGSAGGTVTYGLPPIPAFAGNVALAVGDAIDGFFGVDQFEDTQNIHTIGLRGEGTMGNFDFEGEVAYQLGDAPNFAFITSPVIGIFRDDEAEYEHFGANLEVGYTFDMDFQPRIYLGGAWFEGSDERDVSFGEFLAATFLPFAYDDDASVSFNRLFSDWEYSEFLENTDGSNMLILRGGVSGQPTENTELLLAVSYFLADSATTTNGVFGLPAFVGTESDDELGWEVGLYLTYNYSEDLTFNFGYAHFFVGDGMDNNGSWLGGLLFVPGGNFIAGNGSVNPGGVADDDADYVFMETKIAF